MKKFCKFPMLFVLAAILLLAGCQAKESPASATASVSTGPDYGPPIKLAIGSSSAAEDLITQAMREMKRLIEERSGGNIIMDLYPASQLGPSMEMMEMVSDGSLDMMIEANYLANFGIDDAAVVSVPFVYGSEEEYKRMVNSSMMKECLDEFLRLNDIRVVSTNWQRPWAIVVSKKPIRTIEDWEGLKIRLPPVEMTIQGWMKLGVAPTPVAYNETMLALQQGVVDAGFIVEDAAYTMGWYEAAKYLIQSNQIIDALFLYFSEKTYQSMTEAQRTLLVQCANEAGDWYAAGTKAAVDEAYEAMKAAGVEVISIPREEWLRWQAAVSPVGDEFEAAGKWSSGLYARLKRILAGQEN